MKYYKTEQQIKQDLRRLQLEKEIAWEELKTLKGDFKESLQPYQWMQTGLKLFSKFGVMMLVRKIIK
ncbi:MULTISPECIES: hypothetical protein [Mesoflavibacter]|uniref:Glutaminyl-tRNA synthetase n=1 Tax=Mesoflavibacter profundi TaxID=2708110 RepID=A0ABT4RZ44_9FLAO|nr:MULTISPECIES: hypothetical protein [Mesoflavibacter]MDA0177087.1 hypothetical protein [Mesoflavibacter profundi]QIJ88007.1 hypothetical protein C7H62_0197 [Mesoflavibacter sp. HG96]QIJ90735.1 hypothetical protein C7H56_0197 [Mesoflavibacter sp. HG37]